jgi:lipoprotein NlpD
LFRVLFAGAMIVMLNGCVHYANNNAYAPVAEAGKPLVEQQTYVVQPGDTLYSIAWAFEFDFRELAQINHLDTPYAVSTGQIIQLVPAEGVLSEKMPVKKSNKTVKFVVSSTTVSPTIVSSTKKPSQSLRISKKTVARRHTSRIGKWVMPTQGKMINIFSTKYGSSGKGMEFYGRIGQPVKASAAGTVVYSGNGLRSYGHLLLIKHNDAYVSAYAFNQKLLVKAGDRVRQGQTIASMGQGNTGKPLLYFEIRHNGKPVNPAHYLK